MKRIVTVAALCALSACARLEDVGKTPDFTPSDTAAEITAMAYPAVAAPPYETGVQRASLWSGGRGSLLGDRRASVQGDILTVVIEIDDSASISNSTTRSRSSSESSAAPNLLGIPQVVDRVLPGDASLANAADISSNSNNNGQGSVSRNESFKLRVAATVTGVLQNGVLRIQGSQEVRVNYELRELLVTGYVRPEDITRKNEITYDKIAAARISYGGRGHISDVQQPRYGSQIADIILPF